MPHTLTSVPGILVGHAHDLDGLTGCTAILMPADTTCGVDVRGGAPGTRETDLLAPAATVQHINAICLAGGSAFGLAAATGVTRWLYERGIGFEAGVARVPIVPAAVLFDLGLGRSDCWPDADMGYAACAAAHSGPVEEGCVGAGAGATVGKLLGLSQATKSGLGSAAIELPGGLVVAALAVTNAFGEVRRADSGVTLAGPRAPATQGGFLDTVALLRQHATGEAVSGFNTTLAIVATNVALDKAGCQRLAQMAQDALARTIRPIHTPFDGDVVFAVATGSQPAPPLVLLGSLAADVLAEAIERSALTATAAGGLPAARDLVQGV